MNEKMKITRNFEIKNKPQKENEKMKIQGYSAVFDTWTTITDRFGDEWQECIKKGAFEESLQNNSILALYNHDFNNVLGRTEVNLTLKEDEKGLNFELELPDTSQARDLYELIDKGIVNQCSFAGFVEEEKWNYEDKTNKIKREILKVNLIEITITPIPAYELTEAEVSRSRELSKNMSSKTNKNNLELEFEKIIEKAKQEIKKIEKYERELQNE